MSNADNGYDERYFVEHTEAPYSLTFRPHGGYEAPLFSIRANSPAELRENLAAVEASGVLTDIGRVFGAFESGFNVGKGLDATPVQDPAPAAAPAAPVYQAPPAPAAPAAPAYQAPPTPAAAPPAVGAPMVLGMPAAYKEGTSKTGKKWRAFADPRPANQRPRGLERTNDANHPGLAAGTHEFWAFIGD